MSQIAIKGATTGTGVFTLESPATNTDRTLILPDEAGTVLTSASNVAQKGVPAFSAYRTTSQTVSYNTSTKLQVNVEEFDTNSNYDNSTNYRFTPTVAGYYLFTFGGEGESSIGTLEYNVVRLFKNGTALAGGSARAGSYTYTPDYPYWFGTAQGSVLVYMNGTTDYMELYGSLVGGGTLSYGSVNFQGVLVRAA